jgi:hypothetical protein
MAAAATAITMAIAATIAITLVFNYITWNMYPMLTW